MNTPAGPSRVPSAATSFTSPAPVPPNTWPGSIITNPSAAPMVAAAIEWPVHPAAVRASPKPATPAVRRFGIFPVRTSMAAAAPEAATTARSTTVSDVGSSNGLPEHRVDLVADGRDCAHRHEGDQGAEHRVFEQVLALIGSSQLSHESDETIHVGYS